MPYMYHGDKQKAAVPVKELLEKVIEEKVNQLEFKGPMENTIVLCLSGDSARERPEDPKTSFLQNNFHMINHPQSLAVSNHYIVSFGKYSESHKGSAELEDFNKEVAELEKDGLEVKGRHFKVIVFVVDDLHSANAKVHAAGQGSRWPCPYSMSQDVTKYEGIDEGVKVELRTDLKPNCSHPPNCPCYAVQGKKFLERAEQLGLDPYKTGRGTTQRENL